VAVFGIDEEVHGLPTTLVKSRPTGLWAITEEGLAGVETMLEGVLRGAGAFGVLGPGLRIILARTGYLLG